MAGWLVPTTKLKHWAGHSLPGLPGKPPQKSTRRSFLLGAGSTNTLDRCQTACLDTCRDHDLLLAFVQHLPTHQLIEMLPPLCLVCQAVKVSGVNNTRTNLVCPGKPITWGASNSDSQVELVLQQLYKAHNVVLWERKRAETGLLMD